MSSSVAEGSAGIEPIDTQHLTAPGDSRDGAKFQFFSGPDYLALPREPQPWLIKDFIPRGGLVNLYGKPKTHKSYLALQIVEAITNHAKSSWEGFDVIGHGPGAYLQIDTPRSIWADRLIEMREAGYDFTQTFFADMNTVAYPMNITDPAQVAGLTQALQRLRPMITVIDTLRESFDGDENDSNIMRRVVTNLVAAARPSAIILLSHQRKDGIAAKSEDSLLMDDNRGSGYISGRMDVIMRLTERTLTYQGRSVGQKQVPVVHDPALHTVHIAEHRKEQDRVVKEALRTIGNSSERALARMLVGDPAGERVNDPLFGAFKGHPESTVRKWLQAARKS